MAGLVNAQGGMIAAMLGAAAAPAAVDWYARHRQAWIVTGDPAELDRMLRHPLPPQPEHTRRRPRPGLSGQRARCLARWAVVLATLAVVVAVSRWAVL
jgi:hypothetical protein